MLVFLSVFTILMFFLGLSLVGLALLLFLILSEV